MVGMRIALLRSNPVVADSRVTKEVASLQALGEVSVFAWDRTGGEFPSEEIVNEVAVTRFSYKAPYGSLKTLRGLIRYNFWLWRQLRGGSFDVVHACDLDTGFAAALAKRKGGYRLIYDIFDMYAEANAALLGRLTSIAKRLEFWVISRADGVIIVDDRRRDQLTGSSPRNLTVIYNSPQDVARSTRSHSSGGRDALRVIYVGVLAKNRDLLSLIEVCADRPNTHLLLGGYGADEDEIMNKVREVDSKSIEVLGRLSYEAVLEHSAKADVLVALYDPSVPNHRVSSPNKLFEAMMLGRPIIVTAGTGMDQLVEALGTGIVVPYGNKEALRKALDQLSDVNMREVYGKRARIAYETTYSWKQMEHRLHELYRKAIGQTG